MSWTRCVEREETRREHLIELRTYLHIIIPALEAVERICVEPITFKGDTEETGKIVR